MTTIELSLRPVVLVAGVAAVIRYVYKRCFRWPHGPPIVAGHWLFGSTLDIIGAMGKYRHLWLAQGWRKDYGRTFIVYRAGIGPSVVTSDPKNLEYILKTNFDNYVKGSWIHDRFYDLLGNGIFNVDGAMWHSQRKVASHMFTSSNFKNHIWRVVDRNSNKVVKRLLNVEAGQTVDVFELMNRLTLDTIGEIGFGKNIGCLDDGDSPFLKSFDRAQQILIRRFISPLWRLLRFLSIGNERELKHHIKVLTDYSRETVLELQQDKGSEKADSFIGLFIKHSLAKEESVDIEFLKDLVLNFLIAGRDTTAQALSWTIFLILTHPQVEKAIIDELNSVCGERELSYDDLSQLPYLQAVVNEGLRLWPSVPNDVKMAVDDDYLPDGTFMPKGQTIEYSIFGQGRDKQLWGEDSNEFRPDRWLGRNMPSIYEYTVFNAGPRECLGKRLAWVEIKSSLATIFRNVRLSLAVPPETIKPDVMVTLGMSSGLPCTVSPR